MATASYAIPSLCGGNGYLSTYIVGIVLGNTAFKDKKILVNFFDGITSLAQILIFFLLGLLATPHELLRSFVPALLIFLFLTIVGRTLSVTAILAPFRKYPANQIGLVSFVGLRGAASIVFAMMTLSSDIALEHSIFNIVFCIVLISMALQGSLIPFAAKKFRMTDEGEDVMKTFNDYNDSQELSFGKIDIEEDSPWAGRTVMELGLPKDFLLTLIIRSGKKIVPKGPTEILAGDQVIICSRCLADNVAGLREHPLAPNSPWIGHTIKEYPYKDNSMLVMIKRGDEQVIPNGDTILEKGDVLIILKQ